LSIFKVVTFNVNSIKARVPIVEALLDREGPDVLCLQETKTVDREFPREIFEARGYRVLVRGMKAYNGVAAAIRGEEQDSFAGFPSGEEMDPYRLLGVRLDGMWLVNCYVPQGKEIDHPDYAYKLRFLSRLAELVRELEGDGEVLLVGDLNVAPTEADVTNPKNKADHVCFHRDVREAFEGLLGAGLVDVFRRHRPGEGEFSFWDYRVKGALERNIGWRIDHILATRGLADRSVDSAVLRDYRAMERPSDHGPVMGVFEL